jgi:hypothetical protein
MLGGSCGGALPKYEARQLPRSFSRRSKFRENKLQTNLLFFCDFVKTIASCIGWRSIVLFSQLSYAEASTHPYIKFRLVFFSFGGHTVGICCCCPLHLLHKNHSNLTRSEAGGSLVVAVDPDRVNKRSTRRRIDIT